LRRIVAQELATNTFGLRDKPFYTVGDLARILNISYDRVRYLLDTGKLPASRKKNGRRSFTTGDLTALVRTYRAITSNEARRAQVY